MATQNITQQDFQTEVLSSSGKVLVDFWAPWCGPCQMLSPVIDEIGEELKEKVKVVKINVDEEPGVAAQYNVTAIPTVILFNNGKVEETFVGFRQKQDYVSAINR